MPAFRCASQVSRTMYFSVGVIVLPTGTSTVHLGLVLRLEPSADLADLAALFMYMRGAQTVLQAVTARMLPPSLTSCLAPLASVDSVPSATRLHIQSYEGKPGPGLARPWVLPFFYASICHAPPSNFPVHSASPSDRCPVTLHEVGGPWKVRISPAHASSRVVTRLREMQGTKLWRLSPATLVSRGPQKGAGGEFG